MSIKSGGHRICIWNTVGKGNAVSLNPASEESNWVWQLEHCNHWHMISHIPRRIVSAGQQYKTTRQKLLSIGGINIHPYQICLTMPTLFPTAVSTKGGVVCKHVHLPVSIKDNHLFHATKPVSIQYLNLYIEIICNEVRYVMHTLLFTVDKIWFEQVLLGRWRLCFNNRYKKNSRNVARQIAFPLLASAERRPRWVAWVMCTSKLKLELQWYHTPATLAFSVENLACLLFEFRISNLYEIFFNYVRI
jgi:hypothetical protein